MASPASPSAAPPPSSGRRFGWVIELGKTLVLTLVIFLGIQTFVAQPYKVQQHSMENTLQQDQYVLVDKLTPHWAPYGRGQIIVFKPPSSVASPANDPFIKRIIGVAGDRVELRNGLVYVNGVKLDEPYVFTDDGSNASLPLVGGSTKWLVPDGDLFVMGDHRNVSDDSRAFGPIPISSVIGRAWLRYWPFDTLGVLKSYPHPELSPAP
jgi:signal peptidase I